VKCPLCNVEMRIDKTAFVIKEDGTYAQKIYLKCRSRECANYNKIVATKYDPIQVSPDDPSE